MKFRIWNKMDKKFYTYNNLDTTKWLVDMNGNLGYMDLTDFSWGGLIPKGFYEINQWICKDKNNNDVYEGDIISDKYGTRALVVFENFCFKMRLKEFEYCVPINNMDFKYLEVTGNKYENSIKWLEER